MLGKQTSPRDPGMDADERIYDGLYISGGTMAPSGHKGHTTMERYEVPPATLHIDSKSIRRISTMCQYKEARSVQPEQPWPALQLVLVPKPTKGLESLLPSIPCLLKTPNHLLRSKGFGLALRLRSARVCESNISKCRSIPIPRGTFDASTFERGRATVFCLCRGIVD